MKGTGDTALKNKASQERAEEDRKAEDAKKTGETDGSNKRDKSSTEKPKVQILVNFNGQITDPAEKASILKQVAENFSKDEDAESFVVDVKEVTSAPTLTGKDDSYIELSSKRGAERVKTIDGKQVVTNVYGEMNDGSGRGTVYMGSVNDSHGLNWAGGIPTRDSEVADVISHEAAHRLTNPGYHDPLGGLMAESFRVGQVGGGTFGGEARWNYDHQEFLGTTITAMNAFVRLQLQNGPL